MPALRAPARLLLALALALTLTPLAAAAAPAAVPEGFAPASTSWTTAASGWVLGTAPCPAGSCPVLLHTTDGGASWQRRPAPPVAPEGSRQSRLLFATSRDGLATDRRRLFATHDGGQDWDQVKLPGLAPPVTIRTLAAGRRFAYAIVQSGEGAGARTLLLSSPLRRTDWAPVPGVAVPGRGGWDVTARGVAAYASLGVIFESSRYWATRTGQAWKERRPPCPAGAVTGLDAVRGRRVLALCSSNPGMGAMFKELRVSRPGGFATLGQAPVVGITSTFAAASPQTSVVGAVGRGASWLHATFDEGRTWQSPLILTSAQLPFSDLDFQGPRHGVVVWGGPRWEDAALYRTKDGGHTWHRLLG